MGILNGIDTEVWNPETDSYLKKNYKKTSWITGKRANKNWLCENYDLDKERPLIAFIGRFVEDKGCDLFADFFSNYLSETELSVIILGSGNPKIESELTQLNSVFKGKYHYVSGYNEALSHIIYAGADFLLMPSRVEPCGLNQMYSLRYGTIPIVNSVGGLKDTIVDYHQPNGFGIVMEEVSLTSIETAINRSLQLFENQLVVKQIRNQIMKIDHSWLASARKYQQLYKKLKK